MSRDTEGKGVGMEQLVSALTTPAAGSHPLGSPAVADPLLGRLMGGRYRIQAPLGHGGMADVYRALDETLRRAVAVKVFRPGADAHDSRADRSRFDAEVHTLATLSHPGLVALYDCGQDVARPWCVMQFVDGGTLAELTASGPLAAHRIARIGAEISDALAYVHLLGIVHRDVKPSNVLLDSDGSAYLSDFGVAQLVDATRMTASGALLGTAAYLSPEQVLGRPATSAVDVYALALVLLETATGHREYPGSPVESAVARLSRPPVIPGSLGPHWSRLLTSMTALDPGDRPTAQEVSGRLRALAAAPTPPAPTPSVTAVASGATSGAASRAASGGASGAGPVAAAPPARIATVTDLAVRHRTLALMGVAGVLLTTVAGIAALTSRSAATDLVGPVIQTVADSPGTGSPSGSLTARSPDAGSGSASSPAPPAVASTSADQRENSLPGRTGGVAGGRRVTIAGGPGPAVTVTVTAPAPTSAPSASGSASPSPTRSASPSPSRSAGASGSPSNSPSATGHPSTSASPSPSSSSVGTPSPSGSAP